MQHPTTSDAYFGSALNRLSCEVLAIQYIDRPLLKKETELFGTKWFDYRPMHPTAATYLLAHCYNRAYGHFVGTCMDHSKRFMVAFKGKDFMLTREAKAFWRLRQKIDSLGIRYDFFCRHAMNWFGEAGWTQPPRPCHLTGNPDALIHVANEWANECRAKVQFAQSARYSVSKYVGGVDQQAYEEFLIEQIMQRPNPKYALDSAMYIYQALRIEKVFESMPHQIISDAINLAEERSLIREL